MSFKNIIYSFYLYDGVLENEKGGAVDIHKDYIKCGADAFIIYDTSETDAAHDTNIAALKTLAASVDTAIYAGGNIKRFEDVKKLLYAGCDKAIISTGIEGYEKALEEASKRFGRDKIILRIENASSLIDMEVLSLAGYYISDINLEAESLSRIIISKGIDSLQNELSPANVFAAVLKDYVNPDELYNKKISLKTEGINVKIFEPSVKWDDFKTDEKGLIPVIAQDYETNEVLMLAYMNKESFEITCNTGMMTYYSRSRDELWTKGLTSKCYQYVKEMIIDCDKDTILAKVCQINAACHTGNRSCFYTELFKDEYEFKNPYKVFESVFNVILDRKENPKEGSYTNYLFDKGIDKILKKVGEEATEIVIAAKNPDKEEIKYEISDFLYHMMVLMAERGVTWEEITDELARR